MSLESAKIFLCIVINLTVCQYSQSRFIVSFVVSEVNVTYDNSSDAIVRDANNATMTRSKHGIRRPRPDAKALISAVNAVLGTETTDGAMIKIADGSTTAMKSRSGYPYMALIRHFNDFMNNGTFKDCGGTILTKRWVLTTAQCVFEYPRRFFVAFGIINRSNIGYDFLRGPGVSMITTQAFVHPQYYSREFYNNIALLYMPQDIPFSNTIQPIKIRYYDESRFVNKDTYLVSWGKNNTASKGTRLKNITLPIIENNVCKQYWSDVNDKQICTAGGLGKGICQGYGGSPLITVENGQDLQIGISSYRSITNCPSNHPDVYTRVSSYQNWIRETMHKFLYN